MLCSVPATKSGSNWLNRLRSNKGFPTCESSDLDHFLTRNLSSSSEFPNPNVVSPSTDSTRPDSDRVDNRYETSFPNRDDQRGAIIGMMSNVLSELFFMGGADESSKISGKKIPRKQANPRVCVASSTNSNGDATANAAEEKSSGCERNVENAVDKSASDNSSLVGKKKKKKKKNEVGGNVGGGECEGEEEEEEEDKGEMKGYSRSEVTVIDTSCGVWKTDKLVFRRKNVWKVREKKVKGRSSGRHKRKVVDEEHVGDDIDKKKAKVSVSALDVEAGGDECIALNSIHEGQKPQNDMLDNLNDRGEEFGKYLPDNKTKDRRKGQVHLKLQSDLTILCCCLYAPTYLFFSLNVMQVSFQPNNENFGKAWLLCYMY
ncbi:uncharacterized protein [Malus domestica]|uniref:uncharacterized protein isoform X1 n=1 Tax=Malus domestica TaxID=3750 RepID=UPI003975B0E6